MELYSIGGWAGCWRYWFDLYSENQNESKQRCDVRRCGLRLENFGGIRGWLFQIAGDYPSLSKLSVFMRPQRIVCKLSVNVIIHLEVKLNRNQILKNTCLPKVSIYILVVLCYKKFHDLTMPKSFSYQYCQNEINLKLNYCFFNRYISIECKNTSSPQHQVPWKQCVLRLKITIFSFDLWCP